VAEQFPEIVRDLEARLNAYAREQKPSEWLKAQPAFLGAQGKTAFDPGSTSTTAACRGRNRRCRRNDGRPEALDGRGSSFRS